MLVNVIKSYNYIKLALISYNTVHVSILVNDYHLKAMYIIT